MMEFCLLWPNVWRFISLPASRVATKRFARGRESVPAQTTRVLPGTQNQAPPDLPSGALDPAVAQPLVRLEERIDSRDAEDLHRLASQKLPALLASEVPSWPPMNTSRWRVCLVDSSISLLKA